MKNILNDSPKIYTIDDYIDETVCAHIISIAKDKLQQSLVSGDRDGKISSGRTGKNCWIKHDSDEITMILCNRIAGLVDMPLENAEQMQVIYYAKDQHYHNHYDSWHVDGSEHSRNNMKWGGQRMVTALGYLNNVENGGGTRFTKLNKEVKAEKGKLLVFSNVNENTIDPHDLSEHSGMPVLEGEKWAFNLWFREKTVSVLYNYPIKNDKKTKIVTQINDFFSEKDIRNILLHLKPSKSNLEYTDRTAVWIDNKNIPEIIAKISKELNIDSAYFENICVTRYNNNLTHGDHPDGYDLTTDEGEKYTQEFGQRLLTFTALFSPVAINFPKLNENYLCERGSVIYYNNCPDNSNELNSDIIKNYTALNDDLTIALNDYNSESVIQDITDGYDKNGKKEMMIVSLYVREKPIYFNTILRLLNNNERRYNIITYNIVSNTITNTITSNKVNKASATNSITYRIKKQLNFDEIKNNIYIKSLEENLKIPDFVMSNSVSKTYVSETISKLKTLREKTGFLNLSNLENDYTIDEYNPVIVENVINRDIHKIVDEYFKTNIRNGEYEFKDGQSNRYKVSDEIITRLLQLEFLPLIEKIVGKKMKPTYTYLSAYIKDSDLPPHTDRPECEYTCSYIIGKPKDCNWNIYVHKIKQAQAFKGAYDFTPPKDECIAIDCPENGLMIFNGTDHIHYREKLEGEYYNIVLLHYATIGV